jgi:hypothetical protein
MEWLQLYVNHYHQWIPNHQCTPDAKECSIILIPRTNLFLCEKSGDVHECTADACKCMIIESDFRVCPISGFRYPLDVEDHPYSQNIFSGEYSLSRKRPRLYIGGGGDQTKARKYNQLMAKFAPTPVTEEDKVAKQKAKVMDVVTGVVHRLLLGPERSKADAKRIQNFDKRLRYSYKKYMKDQTDGHKPIFFGFLFTVYLFEDELRSSLLGKASTDVLHQKCKRYIREALEWWYTLKPRTRPNEKYEPFFHTVAYLYTKAKGLQGGTLCILSKDDFLAHALPPIPCLPDLRIKPRLFTKHQSILQRIMGEIYRGT